ncbi:MAG: hypothetical protein ACI4FX_00510 [Agathobacter sp.]
MSGKHKCHTIAFRPSDWQRSLIEERAALSGHLKKDFIARSCIYSNIVVVGKKENVKRIIDSVQEMQYVMKEIAGQLQSGDFPLMEDSYREMKEDYLALVITVVDILNGAAYLFDKVPNMDNQHWKVDLELEQFRHALRLKQDHENGQCDWSE